MPSYLDLLFWLSYLSYYSTYPSAYGLWARQTLTAYWKGAYGSVEVSEGATPGDVQAAIDRLNSFARKEVCES